MLANLKQTAELVGVFTKYGQKRNFKKGDIIIHPQDKPPGVFYIVHGLVKAYDITKYNEENLLIIRKQDEIFPLIWALTGEERSIYYQALAPTTTLQISRGDFEKQILKNTGALVPLLDMTLEMYRLHSERILNLEYRTARERIISYLLTMSSRFGVETKAGTMIDVPLKHQDIASSVNATRETISREISYLTKTGLVDKTKFIYLIKDIDKLKSMVN